MPSNKELLRSIPKVDELLAHPAVSGADSLHLAAEAVRQVLGGLREEILAGTRDSLPDLSGIAAMVRAQMRRNETPSLRRLINATGVILHTNLGRAPLADCAVEAVRSVADSYSTLEYNVQTGGRGSRYSHVVDLLTRLTGAEDALVVNNNASAVLLVLSALAQGKEVIVSRGELVEIGGAFRIPDVMEQSGCTLKEVGATNRTRAADYERAIDAERTGALLKAHTSNFKILGFTEELPLEEMVGIGRAHGLPVIYDLGSGSLVPLKEYGILDEPCVPECVATGVDVLCFSGDKLLGGPQAGIIVGRKEMIARMKKNPFTRAVRIDKLTLAALEATLRLYLDPEQARRQVPTLRMLSAGREELRAQAAKLAGMLSPAADQVRVVDEEGQVGGGSVPTQMLPSAAVEVRPKSLSVTALEEALRALDVPIVARISHDALLLDPRTVNERDFSYVADSLNGLLEGRA